VALTARRFLIGLALAWLVPLGTHAIGADLVLPVLLVAALVAVQRGATTLIDRTVLALGQLFGALCVGGLVISWWPWGFNPVPMFGVAFTVLAVLGWRRSVSAPRFKGRRDALVVLAWLGVTALAAVPFVARNRAGRLAIMSPGEDLVRHFGLYDAIGHVHGYAFLHIDAAKPILPDVGLLTYPQGTHLLYALLARFANIGSDRAGALDWFIWCELGSFSFLALAVLWAVRRVAGPGASPLALALVLAPVAAYLIFGDLLTVLMRDFPNELLGLGLVAILAAVLARPLPAVGEQVLTVCALLVGLSFTYYLYLPPIGLAALIWAVARRRRLRWWLLAALVTAPLLLITPLSNPGANHGNVLFLRGTALQVDRPVLAALVAAAIIGMVAVRRAPAVRVSALLFSCVLAADAILAAYQVVVVGATVYYFEKLLHLLVVVALVALGAVARLLKAVRTVRFATFGTAGAVSGAVCVLLAALGGPYHTKPGSYGLHVVLLVEKGSPDAGEDAIAIAEQYPGGPVVVDLAHSRYANYFATSCAAALRRDVPDATPWVDLLWPPAPYRTYADVEKLVVARPGPVRLLVSDPAVHSLAGPNGPSNLDIAQRLAAEHPDKVLLSSPVR
jgi:hypothetical protein